MERKDGKTLSKVRKEKEIKALLDKCESWGALRVLYRHFNASKSANLKPE